MMKVVILAGGMGTRFSEETGLRPKPMIEIGDKPILWHIMQWYASFGFYEFVVCCGYKGHMIKDYFVHYHTYQSDSTFRLKEEKVETLKTKVEPWKVTLANTGLHTLTAGRILKIKEYTDGQPFFLTYGDGVADVDLNALLQFHREHGKIVTISTTKPEGRFGAIKINKDTKVVESFKEKARKDQSWVNMGFMVMEPEVFDYLGDGSQMLEAEPFEKLARAGELAAFQHNGFWSPMDTVRDKEHLEQIWKQGTAPWRAV